MAISATLIPPAPADVGPSRQEIAAVVTQIAERFHPEQITLFGSRAYGVPHEGSDVDLLVVWNTALPRWEARQQVAESIVAPNSNRFQIHVYTPFEIRRGLREHDFFIEDMMLKGIALFGRGGDRLSDEEQPSEPSQETAALKHVTEQWLAKANEAATAAERLLADPTPSPHYTCFLAQQGVELSLEGLLQQYEIYFPRTHDLVVLAGLARSLVPGLATYRSALKTLTSCAVEARYTALEISPAQATAAVETMRAVRALVLAVLPGERSESRS